MKTKKLIAMLMVAELSIQHQKAKNKERHAKDLYHLAWRRFETGIEDLSEFSSVDYDERIGKNHPEFEKACEATKLEYKKYKEKKRAAYNIQRRLENAIRKVAA